VRVTAAAAAAASPLATALTAPRRGQMNLTNYNDQLVSMIDELRTKREEVGTLFLYPTAAPRRLSPPRPGPPLIEYG